MLAAAQRVRRRVDFAATIRGGRRAGRGALVVHLAVPTEPVLAGEFSPQARAGFVVPKSVGNAVTRNLVRRRLRHLIRGRLAGLPPGATVVIRVLPGAAELSYTELGQQLDSAIDAGLRPRAPGSNGRGRR